MSFSIASCVARTGLDRWCFQSHISFTSCSGGRGLIGPFTQSAWIVLFIYNNLSLHIQSVCLVVDHKRRRHILNPTSIWVLSSPCGGGVTLLRCGTLAKVTRSVIMWLYDSIQNCWICTFNVQRSSMVKYHAILLKMQNLCSVNQVVIPKKSLYCNTTSNGH